MSVINKGLIIFLLIAACLELNQLQAQNLTSSPYSRFALGDPNNQSFTRYTGMGGSGIAVAHPHFLNSLNPATYGALNFTAYQAGLRLSSVKMENNSGSQVSNNASLAYFALGFPALSRKWGMGFGLLPYSNVGYKIEQTLENSETPASRFYEGSGGLNQFYFSNGFNLSPALKLGVNTSYLFGVIEQDRSIEFNNFNYFNTRIVNSTSVGSFHFNFGLHYTFDSLGLSPSDSLLMFDKRIKLNADSVSTLKKAIAASTSEEEKNVFKSALSSAEQAISEDKKQRALVRNRKAKGDWSLSAGLIFSPKLNLDAKESVIAYNFKYATGTEREVIRDTIENTESVKGKISLPLSAGVGLSMRKGNKWLINIDYTLQNWQDFRYFDRTDSLSDSWKIAAGVQYTPNDRAIKSYWK
ncbi:MAG: hypothetical protein DWQ44_01070 [Bacteroidetes bacterium]|nr:MAG: hypothetical protein DWQ44_01070 [Bacteroidota bacterium]